MTERTSEEEQQLFIEMVGGNRDAYHLYLGMLTSKYIRGDITHATHKRSVEAVAHVWRKVVGK